jgi:glycosyltransferase involved in cell wall biosynthesis
MNDSAPRVDAGASRTEVPRPLRLAIVVSHPIQYFSPLYAQLARRSDLELTVYYCERWGLEKILDKDFGSEVQWDLPLLDGYESRFLPNRSLSPAPGAFFGLWNPSLLAELRRTRPDAVLVNGYNYATCWLAFAYCALNGVPLILRGESNLLSPRTLAVRAAKRVILGALFRRVSCFLYIGKDSKDYYRHYGVEESRLVHAPYGVDNDFWRRGREKWRGRRELLRARIGVPDERPVIVFAGKLIDAKEPLLLLEAFSRVRRRRPCALLFAGDGPLRPELERRIGRHAIADVHIAGFLNQSEMPRAYVAGDLLVLPSRDEPWGLVVNEAMNFGLPVVVTDRVGCAKDLVEPGVNGAVVPSGDGAALEAEIERLVADAELRRKWGARSEEIVAGFSLAAAAAGIVASVRSAVRRKGGAS